MNVQRSHQQTDQCRQVFENIWSIPPQQGSMRSPLICRNECNKEVKTQHQKDKGSSSFHQYLSSSREKRKSDSSQEKENRYEKNNDLLPSKTVKNSRLLDDQIPTESISNNEVNNDDESTYWRKMFECLRNERFTEAERQLKAVQEENVDREMSLRKYIKHLESKLVDSKLKVERADETIQKVRVECQERVDQNQREMINERKEFELRYDGIQRQLEKEKGVTSLRQGQKTLAEDRLNEQENEQRKYQQKTAAMITSLQKQVRTFEASNLSELRTINLYKLMTSTVISNIQYRDEKGLSQEKFHHETTGGICRSPSHEISSFDCTTVNHEQKIATKYRLTLSNHKSPLNTSKELAPLQPGKMDDEQLFDIRFEPLENPNNLPVFLKQAIEFDKCESPALMQNILKQMFKEQ